MKKSSSIRIYRGCSEMPIYNFMMYINQLNLKYLIVNYSKYSEIEINGFLKQKEEELLIEIEKIELDYKKITFNKRELSKQKELGKIIFLESKYNLIKKIINLYIEYLDFEILSTLEEFDIYFKKEEDVWVQIEKVKKSLIGIRNTIGIKTSSFKIKYKLSDKDLKDEKEIDNTDIEKNLDNQALIMGLNLEIGYKINTKKTSILSWVNLKELNDKKILETKI